MINRNINDGFNRGILIVFEGCDKSGKSTQAKLLHANLVNIHSKDKVELLSFPDRGLVQPDLVIYLDVDLDQLKDRREFGLEVFEKIEIQQQVKQQYKFIIQNTKDINWMVIDSGLDIDCVAKMVLDKVVQKMDQKTCSQIEYIQ